jgi:putative nucleotidyltransferase with HDIG domain
MLDTVIDDPNGSLNPVHTADAAAADEANCAHHLSRLFRHSLLAGQIHPLLHVLQRRSGVPGGFLVPQAEAPLRRPPVATAHIDVNLLRQKIVQLPSLPQAVLDVMTLLGDEDASVGDIADRIERDQALTARTLRIANSAFYGVPGRIGTIRNAIGVLGLRTVGTLLTTAAVSAQFASAKCPEFQFGVFWRHAIATALTARGMAQQLRMDENIAFTAGLLHDIGRLALATQFPAETGQVLRYALEADLPTLEAERRVLEIDHLAVGVLIGTHWHFPPAVVAAIEQHHAPAAGTAPTIVDIVHVADALAHGLDPSASADESVPAVDLAAWGRLGLSVPQCLAVLEATAAGVTGLCEALAL